MRHDWKGECWTSCIWEGIGLSLIMIILSSCSVVGFALGSRADTKKRSNDITISVYQINRINKGNLVEIHTIKGSILNGNFLGTEQVGLGSIDLILLKKEDRILKIETSAIYQIVVLAEKKSDKWLFGALGIAIDAAFIYGIRSSLTWSW